MLCSWREARSLVSHGVGLPEPHAPQRLSPPCVAAAAALRGTSTPTVERGRPGRCAHCHPFGAADGGARTGTGRDRARRARRQVGQPARRLCRPDDGHHLVPGLHRVRPARVTSGPLEETFTQSRRDPKRGLPQLVAGGSARRAPAVQRMTRKTTPPAARPASRAAPRAQPASQGTE